MIPSHTVGMAWLRVDWHTDQAGSSRWNALMARNPSMVSTCVSTDNLWLLAMLCSRAGRSSARNSSKPSLGRQNRFMSHHHRHVCSRNTRSLVMHHLPGVPTGLMLPLLMLCSSSLCSCFISTHIITKTCGFIVHECVSVFT